MKNSYYFDNSIQYATNKMQELVIRFERSGEPAMIVPWKQDYASANSLRGTIYQELKRTRKQHKVTVINDQVYIYNPNRVNRSLLAAQA